MHQRPDEWREPNEDCADGLALEDDGETVGEEREARRDGEAREGARSHGQSDTREDEQGNHDPADGVARLGEDTRGRGPGARNLDRRGATEHGGADYSRGDLNSDRGAQGAAAWVRCG